MVDQKVETKVGKKDETLASLMVVNWVELLVDMLVSISAEKMGTKRVES